MTGTYLQDCLNRRLILFTGKGGVGKSAVAWATAALLQRSGRAVAFLSWSPFDKTAEPEVVGLQGIEWIRLNALECFREYALQILKFDRVYDAIFENKVLKTFVQAAPGLSETVVAGKIWQLFEKSKVDHLIVDLPASGHALSFFQSPLGIKKLFAMGLVHKEASKIAQMFEHPKTRLDFVAIPEEMSLIETKEFHEKLKALHPFPFGALHVNQCLQSFTLPEATVEKTLPPDISEVLVRYREQKAREVEALEQISDLPLPKLFIPKFSTESATRTIEKISEVLAKA